MIELLKDIGVPSIVILALALITTGFWRYFGYKLSIMQRNHEAELELIGQIHKERYTTVSSIYRHLSELYHNLSNLHHSAGEAESRKPAIHKHRAELRSLVREKGLILGTKIGDLTYDLTDYAKAVADGELQFDCEKWFDLDQRVNRECKNMLSKIPKLEGELNRKNQTE